VLSEANFDAHRFNALVQEPEIKAQLLANTERAIGRGAFGSPTFFVGEEIFFREDRLRDVEEIILAFGPSNLQRNPVDWTGLDWTGLAGGRLRARLARGVTIGPSPSGRRVKAETETLH
jgi:hypothetical protein